MKPSAIRLYDFAVPAIISYMNRPPSGLARWMDLAPLARQKYNFTALDAWVAANEARGVTSLIPLYGTPTWAGPSELQAPTDLQDYYLYAFDIAARYKARDVAFEGWNEFDSPAYYTGTTGVMAHLQDQAFAAVTQAAPGKVYVSSSIQSVAKLGNGCLKLIDLFRASQGKCHAVGIHIYVQQWWKAADEVEDALSRVQGVLDAVGVRVPIWITEMGCAGFADLTAAQQAAVLRGCFASAARQGNVDHALWYCLDDVTNYGFRDHIAGSAIWNGAVQ